MQHARVAFYPSIHSTTIDRLPPRYFYIRRTNTTRNMTLNYKLLLALALATALVAPLPWRRTFDHQHEALWVNQPEGLFKRYDKGMAHGEALFGVPEYGSKRGPLRLLDAMNGTEMTGCDKWKLPAELTQNGPFFVLVNRGKCHFTDKVRYAQSQGARRHCERQQVPQRAACIVLPRAAL